MDRLGENSRSFVLYYRTSRNQKIIFAVNIKVKGKGSPCSIIERVRELIPVLGSQPTGDVSHKPGGRLLLLFARPAVTLATLKKAAITLAVW